MVTDWWVDETKYNSAAVRDADGLENEYDEVGSNCECGGDPANRPAARPEPGRRVFFVVMAGAGTSVSATVFVSQDTAAPSNEVDIAFFGLYLFV